MGLLELLHDYMTFAWLHDLALTFACDMHALAVVPYVVVRPTSTSADLTRALAALTEQLASSGTTAHAKERSFVLKPAVGACGGGKAVVDLGKGDAAAALLAELEKHSRRHPAIREWLLQPFFTKLPLCEYKVFVSDKHTTVVYAPIYKDGSSAVVFCGPGRVYSDMFNPDSSAIPVKSLQTIACTWENTAMHAAIAGFARRCRDAFAGRVDMQCLATTVCRADCICFFSEAARDKDGVVLNTAEPLLMLIEMDNLWSASLLLDMANPRRDCLLGLLPKGFIPPKCRRTPAQDAWVGGLRKLLIKHLLGDEASSHVKWGSM